MNYTDTEWRTEVRKVFGIGIEPTMYGHIWKSKRGQAIAIKIRLQRFLKKFENSFRISPKVFCSHGFHKWYVKERMPKGYFGERIMYGCRHCGFEKEVVNHGGS